MILLQNISEGDLKFIDDINECLMHNMSNYQIEKIVIFSNVKDIETKIGIDRNSKRVILIKVDPNHFDIIKYGKKKSKDYIIYSTPFIKFNDVSSIMKKLHMDSIAKEPYSYYIFRRDVEVCNGKTIDEILLGSKIKSDLNIQRFGYFSIPNFPIKSIGWDITRNYKADVVFKKDVYAPVEKALTPQVSEKALVPEKIQVVEKAKGPKRVGSRKIDVVIVSVNYNDFLLISLENNSKIFENITVVTSSSDFLCQKICKKFGVKCVVTDIMYEDNSVFNKGKAINAAIGSISDPDYILLLDADILVMNNIYLDSLDDELLYTSDRYIVADYDSYQRYISGGLNKDSEFILDVDKGLGFFQLFNSYMQIDYPESSKDASLCDIIFRDKFDKIANIDNTILHLGNDSNWKGRKSKAFLDHDFFSILLEKERFDINSYFDNIYCLNLDRRVDRWRVVYSMFEKNNIKVERFSAIDGESISDLEFNDSVLNKNKSGHEGLIENKNALACLLSHLEIIKDAKENGYKRILIFEDDAILSKSFLKDITNIERYDWKILYLGASQFNWRNIDISNGYYKCENTLGTFAYVVDSSIYDDIINEFEKREKSVDNILTGIQKVYKNNSYVVYPNIVISNVVYSDIRESKDMIKYAEEVRWKLDLFDIGFIKNKPIDLEVINLSSSSNGKKILFIINLNDVGGAEYVSYQHIKMCKSLGYDPVVLSATTGMFFEKIKELDVDLYCSKLFEIGKDSIMDILDFVSEDCRVIYNCNYFGINSYINELRKIKEFIYYNIAHSDIEWVIDTIFEYDSITDKYIVIHDKIREELNKKGVCNTRIVTIPNYIEFDLINDRKSNCDISEMKRKLGIEEDDFIIGMVTRISPDKNILDSIKVFNDLNISNSKLLIVGDSPNSIDAMPYKKQVLDYIKELRLDKKIIITGHVDNDDVYKYLSCFNISLNTSPSEGLPISLLEQMAYGIHCVYPSHGEIPLVLDGFGSVIKIRQKKSLDPKDKENYIFNRFRREEILLFVNQIRKIYKLGVLDSNIISEHIRYNRSSEKFRYYFDYLYGGYKKGTSFLIRARNEEDNVRNCIESIVDIADEIIFVDHLSTDKTYDIVFELSKIYDNIKLFKYTREVPKAGPNYRDNMEICGNSLANYYNFCISKATKNNIVKWDADFVANRKNLKDMIESFNLSERDDKFSLWFGGKTIFIKSGINYINNKSYYDEFRSFSLLNGVKWTDAEKCEYVDRLYAYSSLSLRYEEPCFYEIKRAELDEFVNRDGLIDKRDIRDYDIIESLRKNIIPEELEEIKKLNNTRVMTYGTFDTLHFGHLELFRRAKEMGDFLIVGLSTDEFNLSKSKVSVFDYQKRKEWVESIGYVDMVIPENDWNQKKLDIKNYDIDIFVMGDDWKGKFDYLDCKVVYLKRTENISSTEIKKIKDR